MGTVATLPVKSGRSAIGRLDFLAPAYLPERVGRGQILYTGVILTAMFPPTANPTAKQIETAATRFEEAVRRRWPDSAAVPFPARQRDGAPYVRFATVVHPGTEAVAWNTVRFAWFNENWLAAILPEFEEPYDRMADDETVMHSELVRSVRDLRQLAKLSTKKYPPLPRTLRPEPSTGVMGAVRDFIEGCPFGRR